MTTPWNGFGRLSPMARKRPGFSNNVSSVRPATIGERSKEPLRALEGKKSGKASDRVESLFGVFPP
jgi:hypothetical protein